MPVDVNASVGLHLATADDLTEHSKSLHRAIDQLKERQRPIYRNPHAAVIVPAGPPAFVDVLCPVKPAQGRLWNIVKAFGFGADGHTTAAGVTAAEVYAGNQQIPSQEDQFDLFTALPSKGIYSRGTIWCNSQTDVFMRVYGAAAGQTLQLVVAVLEYPDMAVESSGVPPIVG